MVETITKRDGRSVPFDSKLIQNALQKCFASTGITPSNSIESYTSQTVDSINSQTTTVEIVQDAVQAVLMKNGEFMAASHYIIYRNTHSNERKYRPVPIEVKNAFDENKRYFKNDRQVFQYLDKYAKFDQQLGRRETWPECVNRVMNYLKKLSQYKLSEEIYNEIQDNILHLRVMPSMRLLAMAGPAAERNNVCIYNCAYLLIDSIESFCELLLLSMSGCGVGYSVESHNVAKLPRVEHQTGKVSQATVEDTTEGWVEAIRIAYTAFFNGEDVVFDFSKIRPAGSLLRTKGGRASGSEPLRKGIEFARKLISSCQGGYVSTLIAHDLACSLADAAVCGGVRRSALISLFDFNDDKMANCKSENLIETGNTQRWNANNSAVWPDRKLNQQEVLKFMQRMYDSNNGEPGIFSRAHANASRPDRRSAAEFGTNPCVTGDTEIATSEGVKLVSELIGKQFTAVVNEGYYQSTDQGFWSNGVKDVYRLTVERGRFIKATANHKLYTSDGWKELKDIKIGDAMVMANNHLSGVVSIEYVGKEEVFDCTINGVHKYCANGMLSHNCGEIFLRPFQFCNLTSAIMRSTDTEEDVADKVRVASILGTIQSMASDFKGLRPIWKKNVEEERLLGVDLNGQADYGHDRITPEMLLKLKALTIYTNSYYAKILGINASAASTCVKPSGNSSELLDCSSGLHNRWARYYIRRMRIDASNPLLRVLKDAGVPLHPENGQMAATASTWVAEFPVETPANRQSKTSAIEQLKVWVKNKVYWTDHNPSVTITYTLDEPIDVTKWIHENQSIVGGIAFLPASDARYNLMPYEEITEERYKTLVAAFPSIDYSKIYRYEESDQTTSSSTSACEGGACLRERPNVK